MSSPTVPWEDVARAASARSDSSPEPAELLQLLCFTLAGDPYAIPVQSVREIVRMRPVTPIPRMPDAVRGVISLRGEILQVVDLRRRLRLVAAEPSKSSRIIVVELAGGRSAGVMVDAVTEVLRVSEPDLRSAGTSEMSTVESLCVRDGRFVSLMNLDRVLEFDAEQ